MIINATYTTEAETPVSVGPATLPGRVVLTIGGADDGSSLFVVMSDAKLAELRAEIDRQLGA